MKVSRSYFLVSIIGLAIFLARGEAAVGAEKIYIGYSAISAAAAPL